VSRKHGALFGRIGEAAVAHEPQQTGPVGGVDDGDGVGAVDNPFKRGPSCTPSLPAVPFDLEGAVEIGGIVFERTRSENGSLGA
jgi:hypothetical protein